MEKARNTDLASRVEVEIVNLKEISTTEQGVHEEVGTVQGHFSSLVEAMGGILEELAAAKEKLGTTIETHREATEQATDSQTEIVDFGDRGELFKNAKIGMNGATEQMAGTGSTLGALNELCGNFHTTLSRIKEDLEGGVNTLEGVKTNVTGSVVGLDGARSNLENWIIAAAS